MSKAKEEKMKKKSSEDDEEEEEEEGEDEDEEEEDEKEDTKKPEKKEDDGEDEDEDEEEDEKEDTKKEDKKEEKIETEENDNEENEDKKEETEQKETKTIADKNQNNLQLNVETEASAKPQKANKEEIAKEVQQLIDCNVEEGNRDDIINLLMNSNVLKKKEKKKEKITPDFQLTSTTKKHKKNAISGYNKNTIKSTETRPNFYTGHVDNPTAETPESVTDFNTAKLLIYKDHKMSEDPAYKYLIPQVEKETIDKKFEKCNVKHIKEKVKNALENKQRKLDEIKEKFDEERNKEQTFKPALLNEKAYPKEKRNFTEFITAQENHLKQKTMNLKEKDLNMKKTEKEKFGYKPTIDKHSEKLASEVFEKNEAKDKEAYNRLYDKRNHHQQKLYGEDENPNTLEKTNKVTTLGKTMKASDFDKKLVEKMNSTKKKKGGKDNLDYIKDVLYKKGIEDAEMSKQTLSKKFHNQEVESSKILSSSLLDDAKLSNGRLFYLNFLETFESAVGQPIDLDSKLELDEKEFTQVLEALNMIVHNEEDGQNNKDTFHEKELCSKIFSELSSDESASPIKIRAYDLLTFMTCVIGLYKYHLLYKKSNKNQFKNIKLEKANDEIKTALSDIEAQVQNGIQREHSDEPGLQKKDFCQLDLHNNNELLITDNQSKKIKNKFGILYLNMSVNNSLQRKNMTSNRRDDEIMKYSFKPEINKNSQDIYAEYLIKMNEFDPDRGQGVQQSKHEERMAYIDRLLMKKKKKETENNKIKLELLEKEMENCTFKPQLQLTSDYYKGLNKDETPSGTKGKRYEQLFQMGTQKILEKKDVDSVEVDFNKYGNECTFEPFLEV